jgi:hypothetical protein
MEPVFTFFVFVMECLILLYGINNLGLFDVTQACQEDLPPLVSCPSAYIVGCGASTTIAY